MIQAEGLTKYYGSLKAVDDLTFHVAAGEIVGFLGPNGAGKTTTMRILTGFMPPNDGTASVAGYDVIEQSLEVRKRVGYMPETVPLYNEMSVRGYIAYMAELHGLRGSARAGRVWDVLEQVDMTDRANSLISSLSKGMRQRVGLAQALVHEPEVLILDEPTIGLDPRQVHEARELIRKIGQERTVLLSTHILSEASQVCGRVLIINRGRIVAEDSPEALSARLSGAEEERMLLRLDRVDPETAAAALRKLDTVRSVTATPQGLEIVSEPGAEARNAVTAAVLNNGWDLLELRRMEMSLEDIFLQLTAEEEYVVSEEAEA
jgi:ABC-2 type transport system ATP-binding protein